MLGGGCAATRLNHALVRSLMCLGARCIDSVSWFFTSVLDGVVSGRCDLAGLDEDLGGEGVLWATGGCFRGLAIHARLAKRRAAEHRDSTSRFLDESDFCSTSLRRRQATVDTDRSSASGVVVAPRRESGHSSGWWELSALCGRRSLCARPAGARLGSSVVWRNGGGVRLKRASRTQAQIVLLGRPGGRHRDRGCLDEAGGGLAPAVHHGHGGATAGGGGAVCRPAAGALSSHSGWATRRTSITRCGARLGAKLPKRTSFARGFPQATARISPRNCQGPRMSSSGPRRRLDLSSMAALALYEKAVERLTRLRPSAWHLVVAADDKCRAEHIERIRRSCEVKRLAGPGLSVLPHCRH